MNMSTHFGKDDKSDITKIRSSRRSIPVLVILLSLLSYSVPVVSGRKPSPLVTVSGGTSNVHKHRRGRTAPFRKNNDATADSSNATFAAVDTAASPPPPPPPRRRNIFAKAAKSNQAKSQVKTSFSNNAPTVASSLAPAIATSDLSSVAGGEYSTANHSMNATSTKKVLQVIETEVWDGQDWVGASPFRWTKLDGTECLSPNLMAPPPGTSFDGDWKIVTTSSDTITRDPYGWEYVVTPTSATVTSTENEGALSPAEVSTMRRRIWLRTLEEVEEATLRGEKVKVEADKSTQTSSALVETQVPTPTFLLHQKTSNALSSIKDEFNFKGFGISVYKSIIFPTSIGVGFRIPISQHFDFWDSNPRIPTVSSSIVLYNFPPSIVLFLSTSIHQQVIESIFSNICQYTKFSISAAIGLVLRTLLFLSSAILYPFTKHLSGHNDRTTPKFILDLLTFPAIIPREAISPTLTKKWGMSCSWRVSTVRGYEFRVSYWYDYLPTIMGSIQQAIKESKLIKFAIQSMKKDWRDVLISNSKSEWARKLARRSASLGTCTSFPLPDPPLFSCSALLSLSGFYFTRRNKYDNKNMLSPSQQQQKQQQQILEPSPQVFDDQDVELIQQELIIEEEPVIPTRTLLHQNDTVFFDTISSSEEYDDDDSFSSSDGME